MSQEVQDRVISGICKVLSENFEKMDNKDIEYFREWLEVLSASIKQVPHKMPQYFKDAIERSKS